MARQRDRQRSRVYDWEDQVCLQLLGRRKSTPQFDTIAECEAYARPIWGRERGRVGLARQDAPEIASGRTGGSGAPLRTTTTASRCLAGRATPG